MDGDSDLVLWQRVRRRWRPIKVHLLICLLVPEDGDLHARVIVVMTDIEVLLDGSSVVDVFALSSARRKRVELNERKMTESDRKVFRKATGVGASIMA